MWFSKKMLSAYSLQNYFLEAGLCFSYRRPFSIRSTPFDFVVGLYSISSFADFMNKRAEPLNSSFYFMDADGIKTQTI